MAGADQHGHHHVRLRFLDLGDRRAEIGHIQREEVGGQHLAAVLLDIAFHPGGGDLAVIVVRRDGVDLLAPQIHGVRHKLLDRLRGRGAERDLVAVAHTAFIERVVEVERLEAVEDRADGLAAGAGDAPHDDRDLVLQRKLRRILRIERHVGLGIVNDALDLAAEQAALRVDLLDGHQHDLVHRDAGEIDEAGEVVQAPDQDRIVGIGRDGREHGGKRGGACTHCCGLHEIAPGFCVLDCHRRPPSIHDGKRIPLRAAAMHGRQPARLSRCDKDIIGRAALCGPSGRAAPDLHRRIVPKRSLIPFPAARRGCQGAAEPRCLKIDLGQFQVSGICKLRDRCRY